MIPQPRGRESAHRGLPFIRIVFCLGQLVMSSAASRSVTSGFRPGNMIGSKNRLPHGSGSMRAITRAPLASG
jgi:hypothetical protein